MSWYIEFDAKNIRDNPLGAKGMENVIKTVAYAGIPGAILILCLILHTLYFVLWNKEEKVVKRRFVYFELTILCIFMTSMLSFSLIRCDVIIPGKFTEIGCILGYYFQNILYTGGKFLTYLFFAYRVQYAFKGSALSIGTTMKYVIAVGTVCYLYVIIANLIAIPLHVRTWVWIHVNDIKMCIIPQNDASWLIMSAFKMIPFIDAVFGGYLCYFFVQRLRLVRGMVLQLLLDDATVTVTVPTEKEENDETKGKEETKEKKEKEKNAEKVSKSVIVNKMTADDKELIKSIGFLVWKQTILIFLALLTTICTVGWSIWILPIFGNLSTFDSVINAFCVHLIFSFCDPFWKKLKEMCCARCDLRSE